MTAELSIPAMLSMYALMLVPLAVFFYLQLGIIRDTLLAMVRMTVQLLLVGLYLKYIFQLNNPLVSLLWVTVMLVVANLSILNKAGLKRGLFFWRSLAGVARSTLLVSGWFILIVIRPDPIYDRLFPYYVELCAVSQFRSKSRRLGGVAGNEVMYLNGTGKERAWDRKTSM